MFADIWQAAVGADVVPLNGLRMKVTPLTNALPVRSTDPKWSGTVRWRSFRDAFNYEVVGVAPFFHRRLVLASKFRLEGSPDYGTTKGEDGGTIIVRRAGLAPNTETVKDWVGNIFVDTSVNGVLRGVVKTERFSVVEDKTVRVMGSDGGKVLSKVFLNKASRSVEYAVGGGGFLDIAAPYSQGRNLYAVDLFLFGMDYPSGGNPFGVQVLSSSPVVSPKPRGEKSTGRGKLKHESDEFDMMDIPEFGGGASAVGGESWNEQTSKFVRIYSELKVSWYSST